MTQNPVNTPPVNTADLRQRLTAWAQENSPKSSSEDQHTRAAFQQKFPLERLEALTLEQYVIGRGDKENYCYWLERQTDSLGSMFGGSARKFGVYWSYPKQEYIVNRMFNDAEDAKSRILKAIKAGADLVGKDAYAAADEATKQMGESRYTMRLKPLTLYFPEKLLPINNPYHLQHFLRLFGQEPSGGPVSMNRQLLAFLQAQPEAAAYDTLGLMRFLYSVYRPSKGEVNGSGGVADLNEDVQYLLEVAQHTRNIILYGPPGTGKTHTARAFAEAWLTEEPAVQVDDAGTQARTWWEAIALTLNALRAANSTQIEGHPIVERFKANKRNKNIKQTIWGQLISHTHPDDPSSKAEKRSKPYLFTHADVGAQSSDDFTANKTTRWTLSEEGKEYVSALAAGTRVTPQPPQALHFVTFHPAFTYEEFIQGLRPTATGGFEVRDGVFKRLCDTAHQNPDQDFVLVIDEINRADTAKTFGELITLIEDGKRATPGERGQYEVTLPYAPAEAEPFSVPDNVYVIGTMNTADRSITLMDVALRRRFTFIAVPPRPELLAGTVKGTALSPAILLTVLNQRLTKMLDADHQMGHAYLMGETLEVRDVTFRWRHKIIPLLQEYFYARETELAELLGQPLYRDAVGQQPLDPDSLMVRLAEFCGALDTGVDETSA